MDKTPLIDDEALFEVLDSRKKPKGMASPENRILQAFENAGTGDKRATIHLYDAISFWTGNDARTFKDKLGQIKAETIELRINSPGGSVFEGVTIYNLLIAHSARVEVHIDGLAGSIASVIALAGDEIHIAENAMMMIHNPSVVAWGESAELRKMADVLDRIKDSILNTYVSRTGGDRNELARMMNEEKWFTADEAITHKFADRKFSAIKAAAFWTPEDFPELPENLRTLFGSGKATAGEAPGDDPAAGSHGNGLGQDAPATVGSLEDVLRAREMLANMKKAHGIA